MAMSIIGPQGPQGFQGKKGRIGKIGFKGKPVMLSALNYVRVPPAV